MSTHVYPPHERPDVEVRKDDAWWPGELRMWQRREDGTWWANVSWRPRPNETYLDTVPADEVRPCGAEPRRAPRP